MVEKADRDILGTAVGYVPSGCSILTCESGPQSSGMLASWVQQAGFEPLMLSVAVKKGRFIQQLIDSAGRCAINPIGRQGHGLMKHFGRGFEPGEDAFAGLETRKSEFGLYLAGALAGIGCEISGRIDAGDHCVYICRVKDAALFCDEAPYVHVRKSGLSY